LENKLNNKKTNTIKRILRNLSWALVMLKERSGLEEISLLWSFLTLFKNPSERPRFFAANILLPEHGLGFAADILLPSIIFSFFIFIFPRARTYAQRDSNSQQFLPTSLLFKFELILLKIRRITLKP
jgi:hypothetical protein